MLEGYIISGDEEGGKGGVDGLEMEMGMGMGTG